MQTRQLPTPNSQGPSPQFELPSTLWEVAQESPW
jgi:hypothetical protein